MTPGDLRDGHSHQPGGDRCGDGDTGAGGRPQRPAARPRLPRTERLRAAARPSQYRVRRSARPSPRFLKTCVGPAAPLTVAFGALKSGTLGCSLVSLVLNPTLFSGAVLFSWTRMAHLVVRYISGELSLLS